MEYPTPPEKIANRTVADEYFAVTEKVEALYGQTTLPADHAADHSQTHRVELFDQILRRVDQAAS